MIAIGVILAWAAYGIGLWGVSLLKGWNLGFKDIWSPTAYYQGKWPPALAGNTVIIPDGTAASLETASFETSNSVGNSGASGAGVTSSGGASPPPAGVTGQAQIQKAAAQFGWGSGGNWSALLNIIQHESGGNPNALNSSSGAYGIAQALGHGMAGTACPQNGRNEYGAQYGLSVQQAQQANCGNAWYQLVWMMGYIKDRYGTPSAAWAQYCAHPGGVCWY